ncbi:hypothetical protein [Caudoviricetes sp.]|nr:hypothetical protein [Caudoviricetes sp.]
MRSGHFGLSIRPANKKAPCGAKHKPPDGKLVRGVENATIFA